MTTYRSKTAAPAADRTRRLLLAGAGGGALMAFAGLTTQLLRFTSEVDEDLWRFPWEADAFPVVQVVWSLVHVLIIIGLLGLLGLGRSRGLVIAVAGSALLLTAELASLAVADSTGTPVGVIVVYSLGTLLAGTGLVLAGRRTRIAGVWALAGLVLTQTPLGYTAVAIWGVLLLLTFLPRRSTNARGHGPL